jgi:hypothetical protein
MPANTNTNLAVRDHMVADGFFALLDGRSWALDSPLLTGIRGVRHANNRHVPKIPHFGPVFPAAGSGQIMCNFFAV